VSSGPVSLAPGAWLGRRLGDRDDQMKIARRLAAVSGGVLLSCTLTLVVDHGLGVWRDAERTARIVELEGQTKEDAEKATPLHEERKGWTDASLGRELRGQVLAWALLAAGAVFVASEKWAASLRPQRVPSLDALVAMRFGTGAPRPAPGPPEDAPSAPRGEGEAAATDAVDLRFVDDLIERLGRGRESAIPILQAIQAHYRYLPDEALQRVCARTEITPAQIAGTSTFYSQFRRSPVGRHVVRVCHGTACHVAGAEPITDELRRHLGIPPGADTDPSREFTLDRVACLGCCSLAPVMMIGEETAGRLTPATARQALDAVARTP